MKDEGTAAHHEERFELLCQWVWHIEDGATADRRDARLLRKNDGRGRVLLTIAEIVEIALNPEPPRQIKTTTKNSAATLWTTAWESVASSTFVTAHAAGEAAVVVVSGPSLPIAVSLILYVSIRYVSVAPRTSICFAFTLDFNNPG
jgi:hypothetical protein